MFTGRQLDLRRKAPEQPGNMTGAWVNIAHAASGMQRCFIDRMIRQQTLGAAHDVRLANFQLQRLVADASLYSFATNLLLLSYYSREAKSGDVPLEWHMANFFSAKALHETAGSFVWDSKIFNDPEFTRLQDKLTDRESFWDISTSVMAIAAFLTEGRVGMPFVPLLGDIDEGNINARSVNAALHHTNQALLSMIIMARADLVGIREKRDARGGKLGKESWLLAEAASDNYVLGLLGWAAVFAKEMNEDPSLLWTLASYFGKKIMPKYLAGPGGLIDEMKGLQMAREGEILPETTISFSEAKGK